MEFFDTTWIKLFYGAVIACPILLFFVIKFLRDIEYHLKQLSKQNKENESK
jgi:hypothetical protein